MTPLDVSVRAEVYDGAIRRRRVPSIADLALALRTPEGEIRTALANLADAHMLVLQPESGEVLMANPFSAVPTPFVVTTERGSWYANCIWDGMGVAAMLKSDAVIETSCGCCGAAMRLDIPKECRDDDPRVAHFAIPAAHWWDDIVFN